MIVEVRPRGRHFKKTSCLELIRRNRGVHSPWAGSLPPVLIHTARAVSVASAAGRYAIVLIADCARVYWGNGLFRCPPSSCAEKYRQKFACNPTFRLRPGSGAFGNAVVVKMDVAL